MRLIDRQCHPCSKGVAPSEAACELCPNKGGEKEKEKEKEKEQVKEKKVEAVVAAAPTEGGKKEKKIHNVHILLAASMAMIIAVLVFLLLM